MTHSNEIFDFNPAASHIRALRASLRSMENETIRFQACLAVQNELIFHQRQSKWLAANFDHAMMEECPQYKSNKQSQSDTDFNRKEWERFVHMALSEIKKSKQCLAPLIETADYWGIDKIQYYEWASMGWKYCRKLSAAASQNPVWEEALIKLNQLLLRRITEGGSLGNSTNPVSLIDLEHLEAWINQTSFEKKGRKAYSLKHEPVTKSKLPSGYMFDQFGLIVAIQPALPAVVQSTTGSKSLHNNERGSTLTTTIQPNIWLPNRCFRSSRLLKLAIIMWCLLLAVLSWWLDVTASAWFQLWSRYVAMLATLLERI